MIGRTLGGYRIVEQVGMGGMATVYKAYDASTDRYVALKTLPEQYSKDPQFVERFRREAKAIAKLEHLHILPLFAYGEDDGVAYLAMRYLPAGTLSSYIKQRGQMPLAEAARILNQVASALDHAHANGVLHRDIKPSNILIDKDANAYLTDFGIARMVEGTFDLTGDSILGTPQYMSPEQCQGRKDLSPASDQYSLGVVLYEMVTGRVPFQAETPLAVILMQINGSELPPPTTLRPDLPETAEMVIFKALARNPADRYPSCEALARAFTQAIGDQSSVATRSAAPSHTTFQPSTVTKAAQSTDDDRTVVEAPKAAGSRLSPTLIGGIIAAVIIIILAVVLFTRPSTTAGVTATPEQTQLALAPSETAVPLTATPLVVPSATTHIEQVGSPLTVPSATPLPEQTQAVVVPPTATTQPSNTPIPPTATTLPSSTPIPPTATIKPSNTPIPPTATTQPSNSPVPPTATTKPSNTPIPPTATTKPSNTPILPSATVASAIAAQASGALPTEVAMLLGNGDASTAIERLTQAISLAPEDGSLYLLRGQAYLQEGNIDDAITDLSYAVSFSPTLAEAYVQRANAYRAQDNNYAAIDDLTAAIGLQPDRADLYVARADSYRNLQDYDNADKDYAKAIALEPQNPKWYSARATAYEWRGELESAIKDLDKAIELDPTSADYYAQRASDHRWSDQYDLAMADFMKARTLAPDNALAYAGPVEVYLAVLDSGSSIDNYDLDKALEDANRAIELAPDNSSVFVDRGRVHSFRGETNDAITDFTQALKIYDQDELAYINRGTAYTRIGKFDLARADLDKALELRPDSVDALQDRIENFLEAYDNDHKWNDYDLNSAFNDANYALSLDENNGVTLLLRGKVYSRQGSLDAALADLNRTVELEPGMAWGYQERAFIYNAMKNVDAAVADFNKAIELDPSDSWNYAGLGDALYNAGRKADALKAYKTYVEQAGDSAVDYIKERVTELEKGTK